MFYTSSRLTELKASPGQPELTTQALNRHMLGSPPWGPFLFSWLPTYSWFSS